MNIDSRKMEPFRIGEWLIHPSLNRLSRGERTEQVEPRVMQVLIRLAAQPGELVARETLLDDIWGDIVVSDEAITVAISDLRRVFGDTPRSASYIETIRKGGYRLVAPVVREAASDQTHTVTASPPDAGATPTPAPDPGPGRDLHPAPRRRSRLLFAGMLPVMISILIVTLYVIRHRAPSLTPTTLLPGTPFTTYPGNEVHPAFSHDGTQVAFAWRDPAADSYDIYVKQRDTESPLRVTDHPAGEFQPAWSPDGSTIAFLRWGEEPGIFTVPSIGGPVRRLTHTRSLVEGIDWSPDGKWLVYSVEPGPETYHQLVLLELATLETHNLTNPSPRYASAIGPAFSPDGNTIAFVRSTSSFEQDIYLVATTGGEPRRLTASQRKILGLDWTGDGKAIIYAAAPTGEMKLWRVSVANGNVTWLPVAGSEYVHPSISRQGDHLVMQSIAYDTNIRRLELPRHDGEEPRFTPIIASTRSDFGARYSPDGERIVFVSSRSGNNEIWICEASGEHPQQLTSFAGHYVMHPRWAPDGRRLAFAAVPAGGVCGIYIADIDRGTPRRLSTRHRHELLTAWSRDGEWLYFDADRGDGWQAWKMRPDGNDAQLVDANAYEVIYQTSDGSHLYHFRNDRPGLWSMPSSGGSPTCLVQGDGLVNLANWAAVDDGLYHVAFVDDERVLAFLDFATGERDILTAIPDAGGRNLTVAPDRRAFLYAVDERFECDLVLLESLDSME